MRRAHGRTVLHRRASVRRCADTLGAYQGRGDVQLRFAPEGARAAGGEWARAPDSRQAGKLPHLHRDSPQDTWSALGLPTYLPTYRHAMPCRSGPAGVDDAPADDSDERAGHAAGVADQAARVSAPMNAHRRPRRLLHVTARPCRVRPPPQHATSTRAKGSMRLAACGMH